MTVSFQDTDLATAPKTLVVGSDTISGVDYQRIKIAQGDTGTAVDVSSSVGLWVRQGTSPWATSINSSTAVIGSVAASSQWTVTTIPSSQITVSAVLSNPLGWLSSSTSTATVPIIGAVNQGTSPWVTSISSSTAQIGSVAASSQWTVSVTPTSAISVTPSSQWTVTTTPSSQIAVNAILSSPLGWLSSSTSSSTATGIPPIIGSVTPSSQWTVTTTPSTTLAVINTSSTAVIGSVTLTSGTQVIGSVAPSSQWTVTTTPSSQATVTIQASTAIPTATSSSSIVIGSIILTSGTQVIGSVAPSSQWTVTAITTAVQAFAADVATLMSSGTVVAPLYHIVVAAATGLTVLSSAVASKSQVLLAASITNGSSTVNATFSLRTGTSSTTLYGVTALPAGSVSAINLPYCPVGWITTPSSEGISINVNSTGTPVIGGSITFAAF